MISNALIAESAEKWKGDTAPTDLKNYAEREWSAGLGFSLLRERSNEQFAMRYSFGRLIRMGFSRLRKVWARQPNEELHPAKGSSPEATPSFIELAEIDLLDQGIKPK